MQTNAASIMVAVNSSVRIQNHPTSVRVDQDILYQLTSTHVLILMNVVIVTTPVLVRGEIPACSLEQIIITINVKVWTHDSIFHATSRIFFYLLLLIMVRLYLLNLYSSFFFSFFFSIRNLPEHHGILQMHLFTRTGL